VFRLSIRNRAPDPAQSTRTARVNYRSHPSAVAVTDRLQAQPDASPDSRYFPTVLIATVSIYSLNDSGATTWTPSPNPRSHHLSCGLSDTVARIRIKSPSSTAA